MTQELTEDRMNEIIAQTPISQVEDSGVGTDCNHPVVTPAPQPLSCPYCHNAVEATEKTCPSCRALAAQEHVKGDVFVMAALLLKPWPGSYRVFKAEIARLQALDHPALAPPQQETPRDLESWHRLAQNCRDWGVSVQFTCYEMQQPGRPTQNLAWLEDVGMRIITAAEDLMLQLSAAQNAQGVRALPRETEK